MTPAEIVALRNKYRLTRAQFAEKTRIGEASLARWETGELIQNPANDGYMYLLSFPENLERLEGRYKAQHTGMGAINSIEDKWLPKFRSLVSDIMPTKLQEADAFQL